MSRTLRGGALAIRRRRGAAPRRGAATLIVVMVIFFILSLVAAYASRNLIFEQRTSANQYRATQAFEAAEAGVDWALARLNEGRLTDACEPATNGTDATFRTRYLDFDETSGVFTPRLYSSPSAGSAPRLAGCVRTSTGWQCSCPSSGVPALTAPTGTEAFPAFRVRLVPVVAAPGQPGLLVWGDAVFANPLELEAWLRIRGVSYAQWARRHPAAVKILTDPPAKTTPANATPSG